ncbi:Hypothetical protein CUL131002_2174 [Corynebacterium ulcerans]|nr:Hypothetical protein CUL131002_2174 [Corynebacterium ulcerans]
MSPELLSSVSSLPSLSSAFQIFKPILTVIKLILKFKGLFSS